MESDIQFMKTTESDGFFILLGHEDRPCTNCGKPCAGEEFFGNSAGGICIACAREVIDLGNHKRIAELSGMVKILTNQRRPAELVYDLGIDLDEAYRICDVAEAKED